MRSVRLYSNEWWCVSWHDITMRNVRLYSMNGGVWVDITYNWEVWDYTQWRVLWEWRSWRLTGSCVGGKPEHETLCFSLWCGCSRRWKGLRSFQRVIGSSSVFCNGWLFMCAWFYAFVDSLVADCSAMASSRLLGATAACVLLLSFATGHRKLYWSGCIKSAWKSCFFCCGVDWSCNFWHRCA